MTETAAAVSAQMRIWKATGNFIRHRYGSPVPNTPQSKKITLPGESGAKEYFYDFDPNELSPSGVFFQSALDDMMDEYGALDNSEKIGILMNLVKKLMG